MQNEPYGFFDFLRELPLFFKLFGGLIIGIFLIIVLKGLGIWVSNNNSEVITKKCRVVDKRTEVWGGSGDSSASTSYYITFEFEDHSRTELQLNGNEFGLIVVGDRGELTYQGTRFKDFTVSEVHSE